MRRLSRTEKVRDLQRRMPRMTWKVAKVAMKDNDSGILMIYIKSSRRIRVNGIKTRS